MNFFDEKLFKGSDDQRSKKELFSRYVDNVMIESSNHCNRKCGYCPVSNSNRNSSHDFIDQTTFDLTLKQLAEIGYDKNICLNLYNEPMSDMDHLVGVITEIKAALPSSTVYFSTNGDYISRASLDRLIDAGLSFLTVSLHMPNTKKYDDKYIINRLIEMSVRMGEKINVEAFAADSLIVGKVDYRSLPIKVFSRNFYENGTDRAGSVTTLHNSFVRQSPCIRPFTTFNISYDGSVFPCCQFFVDHKESLPNRIGKVSGQTSIFDLYASDVLASWRKGLFAKGDKQEPCSSCSELNWEIDEAEDTKRKSFLEQLG